MGAVWRAWPGDLDAGVFYAEAMMDTQPWDYWQADGVTPKGHGGEIVSLDLIPLFREGRRILGFRVAAPDELLAAIRQVRSGEVRVPIAATFPLSDAAAAHRFLDRRTHVGKVLLVAG